MKTVFHENSSRGLADHGWLVSRHTFSFAGYHDAGRMNFGLLRVINDDRVAPSMGFGTHPHENMEIISIPLAGALRHKDSMDNSHVIAAGEVQIMSAGTGITHSEFNNSDERDVEFLQIWVLPKERDIKPRYSQQAFEASERKDRLQLVVSPNVSDEVVLINQDVWFSLTDLTAGAELSYKKYIEDNGVYFFVIAGEGDIDNHPLRRRDGLGLVEGDHFLINAKMDLQLLVMEIPMGSAE